MSVSPRQNFLKPPPVPDSPTVTFTFCIFWNSSAMASVIGYTVLEPSIAMTLSAADTCEVANVTAIKAAIRIDLTSVVFMISPSKFINCSN